MYRWVHWSPPPRSFLGRALDRRHFLTLPLGAIAAAATASCSAEPPVRRGAHNSTNTPPPGARKGVGLSVGKKYKIQQLDSLNVDWFYNWGTKYPAGGPSPEFVPMIWGRESLRQNAIDEVRSEMERNRTSNLLGFNEPDHPEQSDMSVQSAIKYWPQLEETGLRLGSPAPAEALGDWLRRFMDEAASKDLRVDFISMHSYPSPDSESFLRSVERLHETYGKPIWITEYAVADWEATAKSPTRYTESEIMAFMQETADSLRTMPFVERFAWKTRVENDPVMGASALFRDDGSLSSTGELYRSL